MDTLQGVNLLIAGCDKREVELYFLWRKAGYTVKMLGFELCDALPPDAARLPTISAKRKF